MNELLDRPYVCGAPGCSQRFQSEEHLSIHRHKHEMTLKFNSIKSDAAFTADTPTPTKFLQNCDEVGLFKEIEEEFLQAQEEEKKQPAQRPGHSIVPPTPVPPSASTSAPHTNSFPQPTTAPPPQPAPSSISTPSTSPPTPQPAPQPTSQPAPRPDPPAAQPVPQPAPAAPSSPWLSPVPSQPSQCQLSLSQGGPGSCAGPSGPPGAVARRRRTSEQDPDERRQKFLERNRAAATRCRQKRKLWVSSLEKKAEELTHTNLQLQNEVTSLRSEVGQLKQILLTHKDCPVTARQREGQVSDCVKSKLTLKYKLSNRASDSIAPLVSFTPPRNVDDISCKVSVVQ
uniref:Cyclic AMP-dependent transcription factor ATF-2 n=1 Tax=Periophthalmus magnuspinnatus TaxID=409849 RepID=A0A3B3ZNG8_9GOBI